jgi:hypothetical protein
VEIGLFASDFSPREGQKTHDLHAASGNPYLTGLWEGCPSSTSVIRQEPPPKWRDVIAKNPLRANKRSSR